MKSTVLWVADACEMYANAFMEYVNLKKGQLFQVRGCTDEEQLVKSQWNYSKNIGTDGGDYGYPKRNRYVSGSKNI